MWQKQSPANLNAYPFPNVPIPFFTKPILPSQMASSDNLGVRYVYTQTPNSACSFVRLSNGWFSIPDLEQRLIMAPFSTLARIPQNNEA